MDGFAGFRTLLFLSLLLRFRALPHDILIGSDVIEKSNFYMEKEQLSKEAKDGEIEDGCNTDEGDEQYWFKIGVVRM